MGINYFQFVGTMGFIFSIASSHAHRTIYSNNTIPVGRKSFEKIWENWKLENYTKPSYPLINEDARLSGLEMPDVQFIMDYGNSCKNFNYCYSSFLEYCISYVEVNMLVKAI